jgi:hypothetical protein
MASGAHSRADHRAEAAGRTAREQPLVDGDRRLLSTERELASRLRRLERMERTARMWVNGAELGPGRHGHLSQTYD